MSYLIAFGRFWYDFVIGDDWRMAVAVVAALGASIALVNADIAAWWLLPIVVGAVLTLSLWVEVRRVR